MCCGSWGCKESERTEQLKWTVDRSEKVTCFHSLLGKIEGRKRRG